MKKQSLGMVETWGIVGAIHAADAGCKAANVELIGYELNKAGFATIKFAGDVGSVRAAVSAAEAAARSCAEVVASHVIPRLGEGMESCTFDSPDNVPAPPAPPSDPKPGPNAETAQADKPKSRKKSAKPKAKPKGAK